MLGGPAEAGDVGIRPAPPGLTHSPTIPPQLSALAQGPATLHPAPKWPADQSGPEDWGRSNADGLTLTCPVVYRVPPCRAQPAEAGLDHHREPDQSAQHAQEGRRAGAAFWAVPTIESVTSRAAAASSAGLSCNLVWLFYQHANGTVYLGGYLAGSDGSEGCTNGPLSNPCAPSPGTMTCSGNTFTLSAGMSSSGLPAASADVTAANSPYNKAFSGPVGPQPGNGNCLGEFSDRRQRDQRRGGRHLRRGGAACLIPSLASCTGAQWACPSALGVDNSLDLTSICGW